MAWNLTEPEQAAIMEAVAAAIEPWLWVDPNATMIGRWHESMFEGKPIPETAIPCEDAPGYYDYTFPMRGKVLKPDTPEDIRKLNEAYLTVSDISVL